MAKVVEADMEGAEDGVFIRGIFLGRAGTREYTRRDGQKGTESAKIGVRVGASEYAINMGSDDDLSTFGQGLVKGDRVEIEVEARPPFGSTGQVRYQRPGLTDREWK